MLKKLLKYDLKWCLKIVTIYLAISLVLAVTGKLIELCPDSIFFKVIGGICKGASISFGITGLVNAIIRSWVRMINNMYKDESYLTHTIPVSISKIYLSKIISTFVILIMCIITIVISLVIMYLNDTTIELNHEETILRNLRELRQNKTTIMIAHRISTVETLDKIILVDDGKVLNVGSHSELMEYSELYREMVYLQSLEEEVNGGEA